jgi:hypothetical protein
MVRDPKPPHERNKPKLPFLEVPRKPPASLRSSILLTSILCLWPCFERSETGGLGACPHEWLLCKNKSDTVIILTTSQLALFRANTRNAVVLEKHLRLKGIKALKADGRSIPTIDSSDPDEFDRHSHDELSPPPRYTTAPPTRQGTQHAQSNAHGRPTYQQDRVPEERSGGWFSGFGSKKKQPDVERGAELRRREDEPLPDLPTGPNDVHHQGKSTLQKSRR